MPKVSVIVPVYRVEEYLDQCVASVCAQTFTDWELILVDDGSPDRCGAMCDEWAAKDGRIRVIHRENGGLSAARNSGVLVAEGAFVFYLDSDDYLEPDALERLLTVQEACDADVVVGGYYYTYADREETAEMAWGASTTLLRSEAVEALVGGKLQNFAWGKLLRAGIARQYLFPEGRLFEDHYWAHHVMDAAQKVAVLPVPLVHYRQRGDSISYTFTLKRLDMLDGWRARRDFLREKYPQMLPDFWRHVVPSYLGMAWLALTRMQKNKGQAFVLLRQFSRENQLTAYAEGKEKTLIAALERGTVCYGLRALLQRVVR
ncbi:MAG: glycosyltransferase family 2 protein [Oscillospiraceae bacterium]|nr:glycosyltransferase family 2 protein [Oscillospiraceae bacterium]